MLAKMAARNRFFPQFWNVAKTNSAKLGLKTTVKAKVGWDLQEFLNFWPSIVTGLAN